MNIKSIFKGNLTIFKSIIWEIHTFIRKNCISIRKISQLWYTIYRKWVWIYEPKKWKGGIWRRMSTLLQWGGQYSSNSKDKHLYNPYLEFIYKSNAFVISIAKINAPRIFPSYMLGRWGGLRINAMRNRVYLKAAADD